MNGKNNILAILNLVFALLSCVSMFSIFELIGTLYRLLIQLIIKLSIIILSSNIKENIKKIYDRTFKYLFLGEIILVLFVKNRNKLSM